MPRIDDSIQAPARLQALTTWQVSKVSTLAARLTAQRMPLSARTDSAVLAALDEYGSLSQADLGRRLGLDRNDVNAVVNRLQAAGHVNRGADATDRRRNTVSITAAGRVYLDEILYHAGDVQDELLAGLTPTERRQLTVLMAILEKPCTSAGLTAQDGRSHDVVATDDFVASGSSEK